MPIKITDVDGKEHFTLRRFAIVVEFDESSVIADATLFKDGKRKPCEIQRQLKQAGDIVNQLISEAVNDAHRRTNERIPGRLADSKRSQ